MLLAIVAALTNSIQSPCSFGFFPAHVFLGRHRTLRFPPFPILCTNQPWMPSFATYGHVQVMELHYACFTNFPAISPGRVGRFACIMHEKWIYHVQLLILKCIKLVSLMGINKLRFTQTEEPCPQEVRSRAGCLYYNEFLVLVEGLCLVQILLLSCFNLTSFAVLVPRTYLKQLEGQKGTTLGIYSMFCWCWVHPIR